MSKSVKFGGTSMAKDTIDNAVRVVKSDPSRKYITVSAAVDGEELPRC